MKSRLLCLLENFNIWFMFYGVVLPGAKDFVYGSTGDLAAMSREKRAQLYSLQR